jgi:hypothetical protein
MMYHLRLVSCRAREHRTGQPPVACEVHPFLPDDAGSEAATGASCHPHLICRDHHVPASPQPGLQEEPNDQANANRKYTQRNGA